MGSCQSGPCSAHPRSRRTDPCGAGWQLQHAISLYMLAEPYASLVSFLNRSQPSKRPPPAPCPLGWISSQDSTAAQPTGVRPNCVLRSGIYQELYKATDDSSSSSSSSLYCYRCLPNTQPAGVTACPVGWTKGGTSQQEMAGKGTYLGRTIGSHHISIQFYPLSWVCLFGSQTVMAIIAASREP